MSKIKKLTEEQYNVIVSLCKLKGFRIYDEKPNDLDEYPYITKIDLVDKNYFVQNINKHFSISFEKAVEVIMAYKKPLEIQLTSDYKAVLSDGFVKVGCQSIPFKKVHELSDLIKENF